jgi:hypothetical protein
MRMGTLRLDGFGGASCIARIELRSVLAVAPIDGDK